MLVLGGTTEASQIADALAGDARFVATLSLAGRTITPIVPKIPMRVGGFGGAAGLAAHIAEHRIEVLIDATHPFATTIKRSAVTAARDTGVPLLVVHRPPWTAVAGDQWIGVADLAAAAAALGPAPRRVFLTVGRKDLAPFVAQPQHRYVVRSVDAPSDDALPPHAEVIAARGPFGEAAEHRLMADRAIEILVTKNSGGSAAAAKLAVARALGIPVVMVARPTPPEAESVETASEAMNWLAQVHAGTRVQRGV